MAMNNGDNCDDDIIINDQDGLPNIHPNLVPDDEVEDSTESADKDDLSDLPTSLIVTNITDSTFVDPDKKSNMENLFRRYDSDVTFHWLRSFRRLRVNFQTAIAAANARIELHQHRINDSVITCYFAQPVTPVKHSSLQPPAPVKQYVISPPASPPVDWQPKLESEPLINHELLAAIATLSPGDSHELHPPAPGQPSIVVHTALSTCSNNG